MLYSKELEDWKYRTRYWEAMYHELAHAFGQYKKTLYRCSPDMKKFIRRRDGYTCSECGTPTRIGRIHHIDKDKTNSHEDNLRLMCVQCHKDIHK